MQTFVIDMFSKSKIRLSHVEFNCETGMPLLKLAHVRRWDNQWQLSPKTITGWTLKEKCNHKMNDRRSERLNTIFQTSCRMAMIIFRRKKNDNIRKCTEKRDNHLSLFFRNISNCFLTQIASCSNILHSIVSK